MAQDVVEEEALLRQRATDEALTQQSMRQDVAQNCTNFLLLVR